MGIKLMLWVLLGIASIPIVMVLFVIASDILLSFKLRKYCNRRR